MSKMSQIKVEGNVMYSTLHTTVVALSATLARFLKPDRVRVRVCVPRRNSCCVDASVDGD